MMTSKDILTLATGLSGILINSSHSHRLTPFTAKAKLPNHGLRHMIERETSSIQIFQINISAGGVPKSAVRQVEVGPLGLVGDNHNDTVHHGGIERALSLYSLELIRALQVEGHPIFPGSTGENITLVGLDWALVDAGLRLGLGDKVEIEITRYITPCSTIRDSFINQEFNRISWRTNPGWARAYARVLKTGRLTAGDPVRVIE